MTDIIAELQAEKEGFLLDLERLSDEREQAEADGNACAEAYENETTLRLKSEAALAERDRTIVGIRLAIVNRKQEAALYGDHAEYEGLAIALGILDDAIERARARAEEGSDT